MKKQLRVVVADNNDEFAARCAAGLHRAGDWAILRCQQPQTLMQAVRVEHPDALILNLTVPSMEFPCFTEEVLRYSDLRIIAFYRQQNESLRRAFEEQGVRYMPMPETGSNLADFVHLLCGGGSFQRREPAVMNGSDAEYCVTRLLHSFGISTHLQGFYYLRCAIMLAYAQGDCSCSMMRSIYPEVAERMNSTTSRVERSIRHAITHAWENAGQEPGWQYGLHCPHRMTNSEFISFAADWLRSERASRRRAEPAAMF